VKLYEAVALSLNIAPETLRHDPHSWMAGRRLFNENQEFRDRLFIAERNLQALGPLNTRGIRYYDEDPVVGLPAFAAWAVSIDWELPGELAKLVAAPSAKPVADVPNENDQTASGEDEINATGLAGRPSSWHLIEAECRKRWTARERHPNDLGLESRSEWASILLDWFQQEHPKAVQPKKKTLSNRLSRLLRELYQQG
jgi:hypothetical protein